MQGWLGIRLAPIASIARNRVKKPRRAILSGFAISRLGELGQDRKRSVATVVIRASELDVGKLHKSMAHPVTIGEEMEAKPA